MARINKSTKIEKILAGDKNDEVSRKEFEEFVRRLEKVEAQLAKQKGMLLAERKGE